MTKIYGNALVFTANPDQKYADSFIVEDGKITWIGNGSERPNVDGEYIDLAGRRVIPGIIESHMHPIMFAQSMQQVPGTAPKVNSIADILEGIKEKVAQADNPESWIEVWGYDEGKLTEKRSPTRYDVDKISADHPVVLHRSCGHIVTANSKALNLAGITIDTPNPVGGHIDRDEDDVPTGTLRENARLLVEKVMPELTLDQGVDLLTGISDQLYSYGITGITEMMAAHQPLDYLEVYKKASAKGFGQRVAIYYLWDEIKDTALLNKENTDVNEDVFIAGIKMFTDGSVSGRTAWVDEPFLGKEDNYGISTASIGQLQAAAKEAQKQGVQMAIHAMGEQAIAQILEAYRNDSNWLEDAPSIRIEHASMPRPESIEEAAKKGIAFNTQTIFLFAEIESYLTNLGEERTKQFYPLKTILEKGVQLALSSDAPATAWSDPVNPFIGIQSAVTRIAYDGTDTGQDERIDVETAIEMYTRVAQQVSRIPNVGQLCKGYHADFVVLNEDILTVEPEKIGEIKVAETFKAGELVYSQKETVENR